MATRRIGLALGSGSARGWSHIGVIDALAEAGIEADIVCGTSIGSLVGAAYVAGHLADLRQWAEKATWREIVALMDIQLSGGGVVERHRGGHLVERARRRWGNRELRQAIRRNSDRFGDRPGDMARARADS